MSWGRTASLRGPTQIRHTVLDLLTILKMLTYIWNSRSSHRAKIVVLSRKTCRSEYSLVRPAAFNTSASIVLTVLESQRKCKRNLSADLTSWGYKKNYSDLKLYFTMVVSSWLKASKCWQPLILSFWKLGVQSSEEMKCHHFSLSASSVGLLLVSPKLKHISQNCMEVKSSQITIWFTCC